MKEFKCGDLSGEECQAVINAETKEEAKEKFYAHGEESHTDKYYSATEEEKQEFEKKVDEYLATLYLA